MFCSVTWVNLCFPFCHLGDGNTYSFILLWHVVNTRCLVIDSGIWLFFSRCEMQETFWPGQALPFRVLTLMNMLLNIKVVSIPYLWLWIISILARMHSINFSINILTPSTSHVSRTQILAVLLQEVLCFCHFSSWSTYLVVVALELIEHLRAMGETSALLQRNKVKFLFFGY